MQACRKHEMNLDTKWKPGAINCLNNCYVIAPMLVTIQTGILWTSSLYNISVY